MTDEEMKDIERHRQTASIPALLAALRECREVLRIAEWNGNNGGTRAALYAACPWCHQGELAGHAPDCALARCLGGGAMKLTTNIPRELVDSEPYALQQTALALNRKAMELLATLPLAPAGKKWELRVEGKPGVGFMDLCVEATWVLVEVQPKAPNG